MEDSPPFGPQLRSWRTAAGLSQTELSKVIHYTKGYLSRVENGDRTPSREFVTRCDAALGADGVLAAQAPVAPRTPSMDQESGQEPGGTELGAGHSWNMRMDGAGRLGLAVVAGNRSVPLPGTPVVDLEPATEVAAAAGDESVPAGFAESLGRSRRLAQRVAPHVVLPGALAGLHSLLVLSAVDGPARERLTGLAGRYAEFIGWLTQESGDRRSALWWTGEAARLAALAGDADLAAYTKVRRAEIALYRHDALGVVDLARQASGPGVSARVRGLAAHREAQGHALLGAVRDCERSLDTAAALLAEHLRDAGPGDLQPTGPPGSTTVPDLHDATAGWCFYDLGQPARAVRLLRPAVERIAPEARRSRGLFGARLVLAHIAVGDLEAACERGHEVLQALRFTGSASTYGELRDVTRALARWPRHRGAAQLHAQLATAFRTSTVL